MKLKLSNNLSESSIEMFGENYAKLNNAFRRYRVFNELINRDLYSWINVVFPTLVFKEDRIINNLQFRRINLSNQLMGDLLRYKEDVSAMLAYIMRDIENVASREHCINFASSKDLRNTISEAICYIILFTKSDYMNEDTAYTRLKEENNYYISKEVYDKRLGNLATYYRRFEKIPKIRLILVQ